MIWVQYRQYCYIKDHVPKEVGGHIINIHFYLSSPTCLCYAWGGIYWAIMTRRYCWGACPGEGPPAGRIRRGCRCGLSCWFRWRSLLTAGGASERLRASVLCPLLLFLWSWIGSSLALMGWSRRLACCSHWWFELVVRTSGSDRMCPCVKDEILW